MNDKSAIIESLAEILRLCVLQEGHLKEGRLVDALCLQQEREGLIAGMADAGPGYDRGEAKRLSDLILECDTRIRLLIESEMQGIERRLADMARMKPALGAYDRASTGI